MKDIILPNGIRILYNQMLNTHSITLGIYIKAGSGYETEEQQGITHLLEHLHFRKIGNMSQDELYYRIEKMGTNLKGITYCDFLQYSMKIHPVYFEDAVSIVRELLYTSGWDDEEFQKEKQVVINQIKENDEYFDINRKAKQFIFRNNMFGNDIMGTVKSVSSLKLNELKDYKNKMFHKNNLCLCITGCVNEEKIEWVINELSSWDFPEGKEPKDCLMPSLFHQRKPDICFYQLERNILDVNISFDISGASEKDALRNILNCILGEGTGSNLQKRIREELGFSSNIYSYIERYKNFEVLHINFSVEKQDFLICLTEIVNIVKKLKIEITERELDVSLPFYTSNNIFLQDDTEEMNFYLAYQRFVLGRSEEKEISNKVELIRELKDIAQKIFTVNNVCIFIAGNTRKISKKSVRDILGFL